FDGLVNLLRADGRHQEAEKMIHQAIDFYTKVAASQPNFRQELARPYANLARVLRDARKPKEAEQAFRQACTYCQDLASNSPRTPTSGWEESTARCDFAWCLRDAGQHAEAEKQVRQGLELRRQVAAEVPTDPGYRQELGHVNSFLARWLGKGREQEQEQ